MQQLAGLFPGSYYNNDESKALDFMGYFAHQRQQDEAFKNQDINRQAALEDLFQTRQLNPLKVDNQRLLNDTLDAQLGGHRARSKEAELKLDTDTQLQPHIIKQKVQEALAGLTTAELKDEMAQINKMLINPHLTPGQRKVFEMLRDNFPENYKLGQTLQTKEDVAQITANRPTGRSGGSSAAKPPADRFAAITKIANPFDKYTAYVAYANELDETDPNRARALSAAESIRSQAQTAADTRVSSGKWEKGPDGKWRQSTAPTIEPPANAPVPKATAPTATKPMYAKNPQTGERIMSTDGGKTWNPAK